MGKLQEVKQEGESMVKVEVLREMFQDMNDSVPTRKVVKKKKKKKNNEALNKKGAKPLSLATKGIQKKKVNRNKKKKKKLKKSIAMLVNNVPERMEPEIMSEYPMPASSVASLMEQKVNNDSPSLVSPNAEQNMNSDTPLLVSPIADCSYSELKQMKKQVDKLRMPWPFIELTKAGLDCQITSETKERKPLTIKEVQSSILHFLMPGTFPLPSKWGRIVRRSRISHTVLVVVEGVDIGVLKKFRKSKEKDSASCEEKVSSTDEPVNGFSDVSFNETSERKVGLPDWLLQALPRTSSALSPITLEISSNYISMPLEDLLCVTGNHISWNPIETGESECTPDQSNKKANQETCGAFVSQTTSIPCVIDLEDNHLPSSDCFDRRKLLLTPTDLYLFKYPVPVLSTYLENGFVYSKDKYQKVKPTSPMYGIDCEMCLNEDRKLQLASISVVDEELKLIYHKLVKPEKKIINYLTQFSGITEEMLDVVTTTIQDVHNDLRAMLPPDAIFVGHSLNNDLKAMKMMHPYVIDTALAYNLSYNKQRPSSLQIITKLFLEKQIQMNPGGHDPTEDAIAALELVQLKLKKGYTFGNVIEGYRLQNGLTVSPRATLNGSPDDYFNIFQHAVASRLKTAVLMTPSSARSCHHILESVPRNRIEVCTLNENKALSQEAANIAMSKDFTFLYMKMKNVGKTESETRHKVELEKLDKRLQRVFNGACQKSLLMCILTGSSEIEAFDESSNGLFMCCIKGMKDFQSVVQ
ncbi:uncharacterized protein Rexo5 isoform X2 [Palaemon carinicauda]|uniref:uncharacterized protein Rexo5 isoform X2 n=1 Tax=Palaemon carinicauda TaxID=392227 RepID=UPI0035B5F7E0